MLITIEYLKEIARLCGSVSSFASCIDRELTDEYINEGLHPAPIDIDNIVREINGCIRRLKEAKTILRSVPTAIYISSIAEPGAVGVET